jgi:sugar phosphate isomerase/epimerase
MQNLPTRRDFLVHSIKFGLASATLRCFTGPVAAIEPFKRAGQPRLSLSLAAYSFREYFIDGGGKKNLEAAKRIDLLQFVDYCADHGCAGAEVTSYYFPPNVTEDYLLKLRRHAFLRGIEISGTAVGNTFALPPGEKRDKEIAGVKAWIDRAYVLGAPHIRIFAGGAAKDASLAEAQKQCISAIEECADYAGKKGIMLGLENHGGIVADAEGVLEIVRAVKSRWFGMNLDTGNFHSADPYADIARCAPYAVNVQLKGEIKRATASKAEPADLPRLVKILREANYQGYVALEYESAEDPWKAVPELLKRMKELFAA